MHSTDNDEIEYRWFNMDQGKRVTEQELLDYGRKMREDFGWTGTMSCPGVPAFGGPALFGFGTQPFTFADIEALDKKLSGQS